MNTKISLKEQEQKNINTTSIQKEFILSISTYYINNNVDFSAELPKLHIVTFVKLSKSLKIL